MSIKRKNVYDEYYLGLDLGTSSVGWATTDLSYNLLKFNRKAMWGVRLFEEAKTAEERRNFRAARRRNDRKKVRIKLLQELFSEEISKVDESFYLRMKESKFLEEDKDLRVRQSNTLFNDDTYSDKEYHKDFPTIYHLRKALIKGEKKYDIRLYYLAIHHIIKNRGHFLFEGSTLEGTLSFESAFLNLQNYLKDEFDLEFECDDINEVQEIIKASHLGIRNKQSQLEKQFNVNRVDKQKKSIIRFLSGGTTALKDLFLDSSLDELEVNKLSLSSGSIDESIASIEKYRPDIIYGIELYKAIYDWGILANILKDEQFLSFSKVNIYEKHKKDLRLLKDVIRDKGNKYGCFNKEDYKNIFVLQDPKLANYAAYVGKSSNGGKVKPTKKRGPFSQEELCKFLLTYINKIPEKLMDNKTNYIKEELENHSFLPKQVSKDNSVIPFQLHYMELKKILNNMEKDYPFLMEKDESNYTVREKIEKIFIFRIPYYVGPLNDAHANKDDYTKGNAWIVKKSNEKVLPWNFEDVVDLEQSAERFIRRMTNKCTYLVGEDVLPKDSLLYSEFMVLNELNNLKIDQEPISVELKQKIYEDVFKHGAIKGKVTIKKLTNYLEREGILSKGSSYEITGIDQEFKSSLTSYRDMKLILGTKVDTNRSMVEDIIVSIVLFNDDKKLLKRRLEKKYKASKQLNDEEIKQILHLKYNGWGRLSKEFLTNLEGQCLQTGEMGTIIHFLKTTNNNLMELLSLDYSFLDEIFKYNSELNGVNESITYEMVDNLYVSPGVKRMIWQTLKIIDEIVKITGHEPKKIFIEMAREKTNEGRTVSRKSNLLKLYENCKHEERDWKKELEATPENKFRSIKLFLYYTQMGKCMYCGKSIGLHELSNTNLYDRDHIFPQSKTKDDSLDNLVLVCKTHNVEKSDDYPLPIEIQNKMMPLWNMLRDKKLISKKKYTRLVRKDSLTTNELAGFINRQLVETRQSTKAVAEILSKYFKKSKIVYVKAKNVSDFRNKFKFKKVRIVNDYHHAQDAYLNIIVGNVYDTKFTNNPINFIKNAAPRSYNLDRMYDFDVERNGLVAWQVGRNGTIKTVKSVMEQDLTKRGSIQFTRFSNEVKGGLFDQTIMKKGQGQVPIKGSDPRMTIEKYGGYNKATGAYFMLVESTHRNKKIRSLEFVPVYLAKTFEKNNEEQLKYCIENLGLENPTILLNKIKINSLLIINGYPVHISGRQNNSILLKNAAQLCLTQEDINYIKKIEKYYDRNSTRNNKKENLIITEYDEITKEHNLQLYDILLKKHKNKIYSKRFSGQIKTLESGREQFIHLTIESQTLQLYEIFKLFQCNASAVNLKLIGGSSHSGIMTMNKKISNYDNVKLVHQSPTGLFQQELNLLEL